MNLIRMTVDRIDDRGKNLLGLWLGDAKQKGLKQSQERHIYVIGPFISIQLLQFLLVVIRVPPRNERAGSSTERLDGGWLVRRLPQNRQDSTACLCSKPSGYVVLLQRVIRNAMLFIKLLTDAGCTSCLESVNPPLLRRIPITMAALLFLVNCILNHACFEGNCVDRS